ncbi:MAG: glycoside hydrolase [Bryobacterales bacterium]|nr:glycoside hydrolase [Bryobacterales bacterium]
MAAHRAPPAAPHPHSKGFTLLFANPAGTQRENMTVRLGRDNGRTWTASKVIHAGPAAYSNLFDLGRGKAGLLYEHGRRDRGERIALEIVTRKALRR